MGIGNDVPDEAAEDLIASLPLMGIGNGAGRRPRRGGSGTHYPSWGLETRRAAPPPGGLAGLITPHGDWKLKPLCAAASPSSRSSLPLMGIGNEDRDAGAATDKHSLPLMGIGNQPGAPVASLQLCQLITPHGDWKPRRARRSRAEHLLITPHGDWKPTRASAPEPAPRPHYPSWGLETHLGSLDRHLVVGHSLPLMGIGNRCCEPSIHRPLGLITPHGDWKPTPPPRPRRQRAPHYPSWGLETLQRGRDRRRWRDPHYPSWGLETTSPSARRAADSSSLPLMGIGNVDAPRAEPQRIGSLPLMGIGNARSPDPTVRPMSTSLPLMGIGNREDRRRRDVVGSVLITPHGDWKPPRRRPPPWPARPHYPSWGLETPPAARAPAPTGSLITPHGDWKRRAAQADPLGHPALITPHGDWKRGARPCSRPRPALITPHGDWKPSDLLVFNRYRRTATASHPRFQTTATAPSLPFSRGPTAKRGSARLTQQTNRGHAIDPFPAAWVHQRRLCSAE